MFKYLAKCEECGAEAIIDSGQYCQQYSKMFIICPRCHSQNQCGEIKKDEPIKDEPIISRFEILDL